MIKNRYFKTANIMSNGKMSVAVKIQFFKNNQEFIMEKN